jgi:hypothetical protein
MKKLLFLALFALSMTRITAQTDIKISPVALLFETVAVSVESAVSENFGLDADGVFNADIIGFNLSGKYYFNPKRRIDGFHVGAFVGNFGSEESVGIGFLAGTKILSRKNILFEIGLGLGRSFDDGVVGYGKLHLGYRFGKKTKVEETPK